MTAQRIVTEDGRVIAADELPAPVAEDRLRPATAYDPTLPYEQSNTSNAPRRTPAAFSLSQLVHAVCGIGLAAFGAVTMAKAGFDRPIGEQTAEVLRITQTTAIGIAEASAGVLLILAALSPRGKVFGGFIGALVGVAGLVVLAGSDDLIADLHTERSLGWVLLAVGGISLLAAFLPTHYVDSTHAEVRPEVREPAVRLSVPHPGNPDVQPPPVEPQPIPTPPAPDPLPAPGDVPPPVSPPPLPEPDGPKASADS